MKWISFLLLVFCVNAEGYAQSELDPQPVAQADGAGPKPVPRDESSINRPRIKTRIKVIEGDGNLNSPSGDSLISLSMMIVQAGNDESYNADTAEVRHEIEQLAQELKSHSEELNSPPLPENKTEQSKQGILPNPLGFRLQLAERYKKVDELVSGKHGMTLLSRPNIATQLGVAAVVEVGQTASLPYLERMDADTFKLRHTPAGHLGIDISVTPQLGFTMTDNLKNETKQVFVLSPIVLSVSAIDGREKIEGIDLPIGKPIITRRTIETSLHLTEGEPGIIELPVAKGKHVFMIVFARSPIEAAK